MVRFLVFDNPNYPMLLKLQITALAGSLRFKYELYKIRSPQIIPIVKETLESNHEAEQVFSTMPVELFTSYDMSLTNSTQYLHGLGQLLSQYQHYDPMSYLQVLLPGKNKPLQLTIFVYQVVMIYTFIKQFVEGYDLIKISLEQEQEQQKQEIVQQQPIVQSSISQQEQYSSVQNNTHPPVQKDISDLFSDIINLSPNNFVKYISTKLLLKKFGDEVIISNSGGNLNIQMLPLINPEKIQYSISMKNDLNNMIGSFLLDQATIHSRLGQLFQAINFILANDKVKHAAHLQIATFLVFLYAMKLGINYHQEYYEQIINHHLDLVKSQQFAHQKFNYNKIIFKFINTSVPIQDPDKKLDLSLSIKKYSYLLSIDKEAFIDTIFKEKKQKDAKKSREVSLQLTPPKRIELTQFIDTQKESDSFISYCQMNSPDNMKDCKIISIAYLQVLQILNSSVFTVKDIHPIVSKYSDIIINQIFPEIRNNIQMIDMNISTLVLMNRFIEPFMQNSDCSVYTKMFLLYKILIPHLYDRYNKTEYVDYFL